MCFVESTIMSTLSPTQKKSFQHCYDKFKNNYWKYGIEQRGKKKPCKRIKKHRKLFKINGNLYSPAQIAYICENNCFPPEFDEYGNKLELSHVCNPKKKLKKSEYSNDSDFLLKRIINPCIELTHFEFVIHSDNMERIPCHTNINKYISSKAHNQWTKQADKLKPGPFFIKDIPASIRKTGLFVPPKQPIYNKKIRRSKRLKEKSKGKNNKSVFKIRCTHSPKCFVNIKRM